MLEKIIHPDQDVDIFETLVPLVRLAKSDYGDLAYLSFFYRVNGTPLYFLRYLLSLLPTCTDRPM